MHYDLGYVDLEERTLQPLDNPFGARPAAAEPSQDAKNMQTAGSRSMKAPGETEASNAGEQLAEG